MKAGNKQIEIWRGVDFSETFWFQDADGDPLDLTGYTGRGQIRATRSESAALLATFSVAIDATEGTVTLSLTDVQTAAITPSVGEFDVLLTSADGFDSVNIWGRALIRTKVTNP